MTNQLQVSVTLACIFVKTATGSSLDVNSQGVDLPVEISAEKLASNSKDQAVQPHWNTRPLVRQQAVGLHDAGVEMELQPNHMEIEEDMPQYVRQYAARENQHQAASQDGSMPFFVGSWSGYRNNWYGDVGIAFTAERDFTVVSLGRHVHNETGLRQNVPVTLWSVEEKIPLAIVFVGPKSVKEGHYRWAPVDAPGVPVKQGREYRITQECTPGMADKWFDRVVGWDEIEANSASGYARFIGGVNMSGFGYPENSNGQFRRAGMVNFKMTRLAQGGADRCASIRWIVSVLSLGYLLLGPSL